MNRIISLFVIAGGTVLGWALFGSLGELTARALASWLADVPASGILLLVAGTLLVIGAPLLTILLVKRLQSVSLLVRWSLAAFAGFFCFQLMIAGVPDYHPLAILGSAVVCLLSAVLVLRLSGGAESGERGPAQDVECP